MTSRTQKKRKQAMNAKLLSKCNRSPARIHRCRYLQVHLCEADEHPGDEALPESSGNKAHLKEAFQGVVELLAETMDVHCRFWGKKMRQKIATGGAKEKL